MGTKTIPTIALVGSIILATLAIAAVYELETNLIGLVIGVGISIAIVLAVAHKAAVKLRWKEPDGAHGSINIDPKRQ